MIEGKIDTYFTVEEFAAMVGRSEKTIRNWAAEGRLVFADLCGVPMIRLSAIENLITGDAPKEARTGRLANRLMGVD